MSEKNRHELWQLKQMQSLPLDLKIAKSQLRIREWVDYFGLESIYVSFSGGKDSTVLLDLVRDIYPEAVGAFSDTGLEFPEIRNFVKTFDNIIWIKPKLTFKQVIEKCGYPIISKEQAEWIHRARHCQSEKEYMKNVHGILADGRKTHFKLSEQWHYLLDAPFDIGSGCCEESKKKPMAKFSKETGRFAAIVGTMACESLLRTQTWLKYGCNAFGNKKQVSSPLSFWLEKDIWDYIKLKNLPYCNIYDKGYLRTGCVFCMFGVHLEEYPNRFQRLQKTHPQLWRYCMKDVEDGGLGLRKILEYIGVPYEDF